MKYKNFLLGMSSVALLVGCAGASVPVKSVYQSQQCSQVGRGLIVAQNEAELSRVLTSDRRQTKLDLSGSRSNEPSTLTSHPVDFSQEVAVVVALGEKPTAGYDISLTKNKAELRGDVLRLPVEFTQPAPDAFHAQVLTHPCLVLSVPRGAYTEVVANELRVRIPVK